MIIEKRRWTASASFCPNLEQLLSNDNPSGRQVRLPHRGAETSSTSRGTVPLKDGKTLPARFSSGKDLTVARRPGSRPLRRPLVSSSEP